MAGCSNDKTMNHCNCCLGETTHDVLATHSKRTDADAPEYRGVFWEDTFQIVRCGGCGEISFRLEEFFSEAVDIDDPGTAVTRYPPAVKRRQPDWADELPEAIRSLLDEVYSACAIGCRSLVAMGARAIVDEVANDKVGDCGGFIQKLDELVKVHFLSTREMEFIEAAVDAGHAAAHRAYRPNAETIGQLVDIVEHLLHGMYVLREVGKRLEETTPKRKKILRKPIPNDESSRSQPN